MPFPWSVSSSEYERCSRGPIISYMKSTFKKIYEQITPIRPNQPLTPISTCWALCILGRWLAKQSPEQRKKLIIATKVFFGGGRTDPNATGPSRALL